MIVGPDHPWAGRTTVGVDELSAQTILGGEPTSGTGTLLRNVLGPAAARLPATVNLGSTAAVKEAVHGLAVRGDHRADEPARDLFAANEDVECVWTRHLLAETASHLDEG